VINMNVQTKDGKVSMAGLPEVQNVVQNMNSLLARLELANRFIVDAARLDNKDVKELLAKHKIVVIEDEDKVQ
jgi:hypothetical protein